MAVKWVSSRFPGVRFYEHASRKHGVKFDRYFVIRAQVAGARREEGLGWASEGWTEQKAATVLAELKKAHATGEGAATLAEKRAQAVAKRTAQQETEAEAAREALTFSEFFSTHYAPHACQDKKHCSFRREDSLFRNWISKAIGSQPLTKIGVVDLERIKSQMTNGQLKPRTVEYALAVVRQVFNHARRTGFYNGDSPTKLVKRPKVNNARLRYLDHAEADALLDELVRVSPDVRDMALLSLHCGLRFGEAAALTWTNVDFSKGLLTLLDTKHGDRQVPMTAQIKTMIQARAWDNPTGLVFPARGGGLRERISKTFMMTVEALNFNMGREDARERVTFHTLRHTFASWHVLAGTDLYTLGRLMGHKTPQMTARYGHLSPEGAVRATRAFEAALDQEAGRVEVVSLIGRD
jgi:integrase